MARELIALKVEVIVAHGDAAILVARQATRELPVVMVASTDAVAAATCRAWPVPEGTSPG
jgi:ABC-type uncharacterized transport system substrate-binding protein